MMGKYNVDGLSDQENPHKHFVKKMTVLQRQVKTGKTPITMDLIHFLKSRLVTHIQGIDKAYPPFFKSKSMA